MHDILNTNAQNISVFDPRYASDEFLSSILHTQTLHAVMWMWELVNKEDLTMPASSAGNGVLAMRDWQ